MKENYKKSYKLLMNSTMEEEERDIFMCLIYETEITQQEVH